MWTAKGRLLNLLEAGEYVGDTGCSHQSQYGSPCYGPVPSDTLGVTGYTPKLVKKFTCGAEQLESARRV